jgi:hypothetical protein
VHSYPTFHTSLEDMGKIGGAGIRVYFELLWRLPCILLVLALLNTPSLWLNYHCCGHDEQGRPSMYENRNITRQYRTTYAKTTLGSIAASAAELDNGEVGSLWVRSVLDGISGVLFMVFILLWARKRKEIRDSTDRAMASMSDYSLRIRAETPWESGKGGAGMFKDKLEAYLSQYGTICHLEGDADGDGRTIELGA